MTDRPKPLFTTPTFDQSPRAIDKRPDYVIDAANDAVLLRPDIAAWYEQQQQQQERILPAPAPESDVSADVHIRVVGGRMHVQGSADLPFNQRAVAMLSLLTPGTNLPTHEVTAPAVAKVLPAVIKSTPRSSATHSLLERFTPARERQPINKRRVAKALLAYMALEAVVMGGAKIDGNDNTQQGILIDTSSPVLFNPLGPVHMIREVAQGAETTIHTVKRLGDAAKWMGGVVS